MQEKFEVGSKIEIESIIPSGIKYEITNFDLKIKIKELLLNYENGFYSFSEAQQKAKIKKKKLIFKMMMSFFILMKSKF